MLVSATLMVLAAIPTPQSVEREIETELQKIKAPGASVLVIQGDARVIDRGFGTADLENDVPMRADAVHDIASVGKQFTAAAILLLDQESKLSVRDPLSEYFPGQGEAWQTVTIRDLLHHTSGLPDYLPVLNDFRREWTDDEMVDSVGKRPLKFAPGSKWEYSNTGYMLLGIIVARVSGMSFGEFLQNHFWSPLGMSDARMNGTRDIIARRIGGYDLVDGKLIRAEFTSRSLSQTGDRPAMGTTEDMWRWTRALHDGKVLDAAHTKLMLTPSEPSLRAGRGFGCGLVVEKVSGGTLYSHAGGWAGTSTIAAYCPEKKLFYAVLCNLARVDLGSVEKLIRNHFLSDKD